MIVNRTILCYRSTAETTADLLPLQASYRFRQLDAAAFRASRLGREKGRAAVFAERLAEGHEAWGYVDASGEIACYLWLTLALDTVATASFECGLKAEIPARTGYIWDCRSHPDHEGKGLYRHGLQAVRKIAAGRGAEDVLIVSRQENKRSAASIEHVGFEPFAVLRMYALWDKVLLRGAGGISILRTGSQVRLSDGG